MPLPKSVNKTAASGRNQSVKYLMLLIGLIPVIISLVAFALSGLGRFPLFSLGIGLIFIGYGLSPRYLAQNLSGGYESLKGVSSVMVALGGLVICAGELLHYLR